MVLDGVFTAEPSNEAARKSKHPDAVGVSSGQAPPQEFSVARFGDTADMLAQMYVQGTSYSELVGEAVSESARTSEASLLENDASAGRCLDHQAETDELARPSKVAKK